MKKISILIALFGISVVSTSAMEEAQLSPQTIEKLKKLACQMAQNDALYDEACTELEKLHNTETSYEQKQRYNKMKQRYGNAYEEYLKNKKEAQEESLIKTRKQLRLKKMGEDMQVIRLLDKDKYGPGKIGSDPINPTQQ